MFYERYFFNQCVVNTKVKCLYTSLINKEYQALFVTNHKAHDLWPYNHINYEQKIILKYLINVWILLWVGEHIKPGVQSVQQSDNLHGSCSVSVVGAILAEPDYPREHDSDGIEPLGRHGAFVAQLVRHTDGQHRVQQPETQALFIL